MNNEIYIPEMSVLKSELNRMSINWVNQSKSWKVLSKYTPTGFEEMYICKISFTFGKTHYYVANGYKTNGGYDEIPYKNKGLLEVTIDNDNSIGCLKADDVIEMVLKKVVEDVKNDVFDIGDYKTVFMQAIEKQISQKPIEILGETVCHNCKGVLYSSDFSDWDNYRYKTPCCKYCGQKLDWRNKK